jgi:hypothetical protein
MSVKLKFFYKTDRLGNPVIGSNVNLTKRPSGLYWAEYESLRDICCNPGLQPPESTCKTHRYFVRVDGMKMPISGSLVKMRCPMSPYGGSWQEITPQKYICCKKEEDEFPIIEPVEPEKPGPEDGDIGITPIDTMGIESFSATRSFNPLMNDVEVHTGSDNDLFMESDIDPLDEEPSKPKRKKRK